MTEKKKLPERSTTYNYWAITEKDATVFHNVNHDSDSSIADRAQQQQHRLEQRWHQEGGRRQRENVGTPVSLRRVVTVPPADPAYAGNAFVERQRRRRERTQSHSDKSDGQTQYVARTLAQTGTRASNGRMPIVRRSLPAQRSSIPARSGRQKPKRNGILRFLSFLTASAIIVMFIVFMFTGSAFRIAQISIVGTHNAVLVQQVRKMGMQGKNIFLLDVAGLTSQIEALPEVNTVDLSKLWPNKVVVAIKERVPVLLWQTTRATFTVDSQGMVIASATHSAGENHLITVIDTSQQAQRSRQTANRNAATVLRPGMWINKADISFINAIMKQLPSIAGEPASSFKLYYNGTMYTSTSVHQTSGEQGNSSGTYSIENLVDGWRAYLGSADDTNSLGNRLLELHSILNLAQQQQLKVATIDLRYGLHPVFTVQ